MRKCVSSSALVFGVWLVSLGQGFPEPEEFLRTRMQLSANQIAEIRKGKAVAKILPSAERSDILVSGAVYIRAKPIAYVQLMSDVDRLRKLPGYLGAGEFSNPPQIDDLNGFSLDQDDIKDLKKCKPSSCELQLPEESMEAVRNSIDWRSRDLLQQINNRAKRGMIGLLEAYQQNGGRALGTYVDKPDPVPVAEQFKSLLSRVEFVPQYLSDLNRYLIDYPNSKPDGTREFFYWEKVNFGLKPTIRLNHGVVYRASDSEQQIHVLAIKQLYATHYFQTAVDLSFCIQKSGVSGKEGFYLITIKASRQAGLAGFKGGVIRKIAVGKTRSSLERALNSIAKTLEHPVESRPQQPH